MINERMDDQNEEENEFPCAKCNHNLNYPTLQLHSHPILHSFPLCALCIDEAQTFLKTTEGKDYCTICLENDDCRLYACSDLECDRGYCGNCLVTYFGEAYLQMVEECDDWLCMHCQPQELAFVSDRFEDVHSRSVYARTVELEEGEYQEYLLTSNETAESCSIEDYKTIRQLRNILLEIEDDKTASSLLLEDQDFLDCKRSEIEEELGVDNQSEVEEEFQELKEKYKTHIEILDVQILAVQESLQNFGVDLKSLYINEESLSEKELFESLLLVPQDTFSTIVLAEENISADMKTEEERQDGNDGEYNEILATTEQLEHQIVRKYHSFDEPNSGSYPSYFRFVFHSNEYCAFNIKDENVPKTILSSIHRYAISPALLKTLYHCTQSESDILTSVFDIPLHIKIVMRYAKRELSIHAKTILPRYSCAKTVPISVLKAMTMTSDLKEVRILKEHYQVAVDTEVEDINDEQGVR